MKYIITEDRLNHIMFKYLDVKLNRIEEREGYYVDVTFVFPNEKYGMFGWIKSGHLFVFVELVDEISNFFGIEHDDTLNVLGKWVEDRFNLKVTNAEITSYKTSLETATDIN
jgi:hypothetical protein